MAIPSFKTEEEEVVGLDNTIDGLSTTSNALMIMLQTLSSLLLVPINGRYFAQLNALNGE